MAIMHIAFLIYVANMAFDRTLSNNELFLNVAHITPSNPQSKHFMLAGSQAIAFAEAIDPPDFVFFLGRNCILFAIRGPHAFRSQTSLRPCAFFIFRLIIQCDNKPFIGENKRNRQCHGKQKHEQRHGLPAGNRGKQQHCAHAAGKLSDPADAEKRKLTPRTLLRRKHKQHPTQSLDAQARNETQ